MRWVALHNTNHNRCKIKTIGGRAKYNHTNLVAPNASRMLRARAPGERVEVEAVAALRVVQLVAVMVAARW